MELTYEELATLSKAFEIAEKRMRGKEDYLTNPWLVRDYLKIWAARLDAEAFGVIWLDTRHGVICAETLFHGSIDGASVYPRIVVKRGLENNAAACILFHNHPSGNPEPSQADRQLTAKLKDALALVEIRVLDHMVIGEYIESLAELGWV